MAIEAECDNPTERIVIASWAKQSRKGSVFISYEIATLRSQWHHAEIATLRSQWHHAEVAALRSQWHRDEIEMSLWLTTKPEWDCSTRIGILQW